MFIGDWMKRGAQYWADHTAVVDTARGADGRFSYAQMNDRANRLANWLRGQGVVRGDRVGLLAHNGVEYLDALFACAKLGAIFVPYNWRLHPRELNELFVSIAPRVLLVAPDFREGAGAYGTQLLLGDDYERAIAASDATVVENPEVREDDTLCLLFTGGTTGQSKGARISYRMVAWNTLTTLVHEVRAGDVTVTHTPMFHTGGLLVYTLPLLTVGGTVVLVRKWDPDAMLELIGREKPTLMFCVPTQYQQMLESNAFPKANLQSLRFFTSGGAPLPVPLIQAWQQVHAVPFKQGFGMTEFGPGIFSMGPEHAVAKAGSVGRPNYFVDVKLVNDDGQRVAPGETGELLLKGPMCFSGYFGGRAEEEATREAIDADGWLHTGDLARCDADGFFFIAGRKKDMFISGGENVYPLEIEGALYEHPAVQQCAVIGSPDPKWGEVGKAFVVLKPGAAATPDALLAHLRTRLARYKVPKSVELLEQLPISPAGKILKRELARRQ